MDNAIEAIRQLPIEQRQIKLQLTYDSSVLYLFVSNPCGKELEIHNGLITSTKADHDNHGLGLKSVYRSVQRYPGSLAQIETEEGWFHADIILYEPAQWEKWLVNKKTITEKRLFVTSPRTTGVFGLW